MLSSKTIVMVTQSHFLIGAASSGSGKTTLTIGLLRALANRKLNVQPFKCGPDYIDTKFHETAAGNPSVNLDTFLSSEKYMVGLFNKYSQNKDVAIVEGVMGLFDGYDKMKGSSAEIANLLNIPVILVINAKSMAYSVGALLYGFKNFYQGINVVGVIFNFVSSESHYNYLKTACESVGIEALGYIPKANNIEMPSRHLGLSLDNENQFSDMANEVARLVEKNVNLDRLLEITRRNVNPINFTDSVTNGRSLKIAVAQDAAFNFTYYENIEYLKRIGQIYFFSPISDSCIPEVDLLYLPGGYPELYLSDLEQNKAMKQCLKNYIENGGKTIAECGGMMYLCDSIIGMDGKSYSMVGVLHQKATMQNMKLKLGYRQFSYNSVNLRGHEFHYSDIVEDDMSTITATPILNAKGQSINTKLFRYKNLIAGYTHIYWGEVENILELFD